ncbi:hypothetical protein JAB9_21290 [Janthinobacterium sp. HH107]|uniref:hypothetical protein n=1 Tax=Janthinobacterium sp. HH107 TaxID=1537279 RepID=UPI0008933CC1|nr:hypothetical protein [Janthinobacterium sp. HH107]OEZ99485.1 hypothetical protein JAB9_21290 [Janthinobacterium sp. HH107]
MFDESGLAKTVNFGPIGRYRSYWAGHFYSVLRCLRYHNGLEYPGRKMANYGVEDWSLSQLRGSAPANFFEKINQFMVNWGFQYLMASLLNTRSASPVVEQLILEIERLWGLKFDKGLTNYMFHVSGRDSDLSHGLDLLFADVFPSIINLSANQKHDAIAESDLCLILQNPNNLQKVGIFGEVEGLKGDKILLNSFWKKKSQYCVYAFGVRKEQGSSVHYQVRHLDGLYRVLITFQADHFVVNDFQNTLWWLHYLFQNGPSRKVDIRDEEFGYFYSTLQRNWNRPISEVLELISQHMGEDDAIESVPGASPIITNLTS